MGLTYADLKNGDTPFVAPSAAANPVKVNKYVAPAAARDPELTRRLQIMARQLGRERPGGITSADVINALEAADPAMHERLQQRDKRLMGAVFADAEWAQTSEWRPTGSHGRPQRVWMLKQSVAA